MAKLYFYYASMNAGKSTTLLQADFNYRERGMETMLWTAALDDRYGAGQVTSRIGLMAEAHKFDPDSDLWAAVNAENAERPLACVLVDEAQFLSRAQVLQLARLADEANIPVLCYGLRTDFAANLEMPPVGGFYPIPRPVVPEHRHTEGAGDRVDGAQWAETRVLVANVLGGQRRDAVEQILDRALVEVVSRHRPASAPPACVRRAR